MHKTVRYYITEADDRPVVRTVPVAFRHEPAVDQRFPDADHGQKGQVAETTRRSRLRSKLWATRSGDNSA